MTAITSAAAEDFARGLLEAAGLDSQLAQAVATQLVSADQLGHHTHGMALLAPYLEQIDSGGMRLSGTHVVLSDQPTAFHWSAERLPGAYVLNRALEELVRRARSLPVVTASIAECFHIGALQIYLETATRQDMICLMATTDPSVRSVAPFGGIDPVLTSNPIACGIPTRGDPILIDMCTSTTSNAGASEHAKLGKSLPGAWLLDDSGNPSADPSVLRTKPPGTILPLGGTDLGYKGFGLGIIVEALALALSGYGRTVSRDRFGEGVFVQVINPEHFAGRDAFLDEMQDLVDSSHASRPTRDGTHVRMPGERALERRRHAEVHGLELRPDVLASLHPWMERFGIRFARD